jgi:hypothetical protein
MADTRSYVAMDGVGFPARLRGPPVTRLKAAGRRRRLARYRRGAKMSAFQPISETVMPPKKRELIDTGTDKRYVRRDERGRFTTDQVDVGRSSAADQRHQAKTTAKPGQGEKGDR